MASLQNIFQGGFDATSVAPDAGGGDFPVIDAGTLLDFEITGAEVKEASTGNGCYLLLESTVIGPTHAGRKVWQNITLRNTSAEAEKIGNAQLSALCHAVNIPKLDDTDQLFQKTFRGRVGVEPAKGQYKARNKIEAFEARGSAAPAPSAQRPAANTPAAPAAAAGAKKAPWAK